MSDPTTTSHGPAPHDRPEPRGPLEAIFAPRAVAVIGATEKAGSVGRTILWNLIGSPFGGTVYPVNPKRPNVLGIRAYPSIAAVPEPVDLAVIVTPGADGPRGHRRVRRRRGQGRDHHLGRLQGGRARGRRARAPGAGAGPPRPDAAHRAELPGRDEPRAGAQRHVRRGHGPAGQRRVPQPERRAAARRSSTGACASNVGFSAFVSIGSMLDVGWGDLIDYLADDPDTKSIVIYMESIGDARAFLSAAREVALTKPIIVIKAGRTEAAAKAAASHTGSMAGSDEVLDAAFRRVRRAAGQLDRARSSTWPRCWPSSRGRAGRGWRSSPTPAGPACWPPTP